MTRLFTTIAPGDALVLHVVAATRQMFMSTTVINMCKYLEIPFLLLGSQQEDDNMRVENDPNQFPKHKRDRHS